MKLGRFVLFLQIFICGAFYTDYCDHEEVIRAVTKSVDCKKKEIEAHLDKNPLSSTCLVVVSSKYIKGCIKKGFKHCLSEKNLNRLSERPRDIAVKGLKRNCPGT